MKTSWLVLAILALAVAGAGGTHNAAQVPPSSLKSIELPPDNAVATLKPGPGLDVVESNCAICHSTDYIVRQPGGDAKHWEPEVRKMIAVYGVQLSEPDVQTIVNYLGTEYSAAPVAATPEAPKSSTRQTSPALRNSSKATDHR